MSSNEIVALAIGAVALVLTYSGCYQFIGLQKRASSVIAIAFGLITYLFLIENPTILMRTWTQIALALIAAVIGVAFIIRWIFTR